jgi:hypothetical protein
VAVAEFWFVAECLFLADWLPYLPYLNSLDVSTSSVLQLKGQTMPHANLAALRPSVATEWVQLVVVQIRRTCRSFRCCR